jgi:hypothetical protein
VKDRPLFDWDISESKDIAACDSSGIPSPSSCGSSIAGTNCAEAAAAKLLAVAILRFGDIEEESDIFEVKFP